MNVTIVGAGISGLATAHALLALKPDLDVRILEASERTGGKAWTDHTDGGYACEWGVNGFLNNKPRTLELAAALGLQALQADKAASRRYVFRHARLHPLPESPVSFLTSGLMSLPGRLRVMAEPFIARASLPDETLAEFAVRRLGTEALAALIDPMASGVFAGDPQRMSLKSCFPRIRALEDEYGSLVRGMVRLQIKARRAGAGKGPGPGPGGTLTSFAGGISDLIQALSLALGARIRTRASVERVLPCAQGYQLHLQDGQTLEAGRLILAAPAWAQARMLSEVAPGISSLLAGIEYPPLTVVCLGYRAASLETRPDGFGFLVPSGERRRLLGTIVDSNVFPGRAPDGSVLLRTMVGGSRAPGLAGLPDAQLLDLVRAELKDILGINAEPELTRIYRHHRAIPQYHVGHADRLAAVEYALGKLPGLMLTGNAYRGVSLNDCVENAWALARQVMFSEKGTGI